MNYFFPEEFLYEDFDFALEKRRTTDTDDYAFLDENENIEDEDVFPKSRQKRSKNDDDELDPIRSDFHVVYRRKDNMDHISDYREYIIQNQFVMKLNYQCVSLLTSRNIQKINSCCNFTKKNI